MLRENNLYLYLVIFVFINLRNITIQGIYIKVTYFNIYPNFWDVLHIFSLAIITYLERLFGNCYLQIVPCFSSLTLHIVNFLFCKKIITVSRPTIFKTFLMVRSGCPNKRGNWGFPASLKIETFPFSWIKLSHIGKSHILGKNISLLAFRQVLTKIFPCSMSSVTQLWLIWKSSIKTKSFNTKQRPAGISPKMIC